MRNIIVDFSKFINDELLNNYPPLRSGDEQFMNDDLNVKEWSSSTEIKTKMMNYFNRFVKYYLSRVTTRKSFQIIFQLS